MKTIILALAALGTVAATPVLAGPAVSTDKPMVVAQGVDVRIGGDRDRDRDRGFREGDRFRDRDFRDRDRDRFRFGIGRREFGEGCRTVVIRDRRPNGTLVVRRIRRCG